MDVMGTQRSLPHTHPLHLICTSACQAHPDYEPSDAHCACCAPAPTDPDELVAWKLKRQDGPIPHPRLTEGDSPVSHDDFPVTDTPDNPHQPDTNFAEWTAWADGRDFATKAERARIVAIIDVMERNWRNDVGSFVMQPSTAKRLREAIGPEGESPSTPKEEA